MRRATVFVSVLAVVLLGGLAAGRLTVATEAQQGTPPAGQAGPPEGVSYEPIAAGLTETLPPTPATVGLARIRFEPGAALSTPADDPSLVLVYLESGTLTCRLTVPVVVTRGARAQEEVAAGAEFTLGPGDSFLAPPVSGGEIRNDGQEPAVILGTSIAPQQAAGTPTP